MATPQDKCRSDRSG